MLSSVLFVTNKAKRQQPVVGWQTAVQTKPIWGGPAQIRASNYAKRSQFGELAGWGQLYKQTQFAPDGATGPSPRPLALTLPPAPGSSAPNKANLPASAGKDGGRPGQGRCRRRAGSCETKPIPGGAKGRVSALWGRIYGESYIRQVPAKQTQFRRMGHSRTIATAGDDAIRRRGNRAKQSQFLAVSGEDAHPTKRSKRAKQSQFPAGAGSGAEGCCTNKPNSRHYADPEIGVPGRANCAKQSQLGARCPEMGAGRPAGAFRRGRLCQTNPISGVSWKPRGPGI
jgi:hypothetical protein